ncbi:MAG TPA: NAD-dependent epimerase/dehydratase family protein, partial [Candidatus Acetothermia bacterium]|nr:NAD-dependent epimerase/dehydratase family protein [Candidatus Acetothermia bacterium]
SFRPHVVNHHAAQIDIRRSVEDPVFDAEVNVIGSVNLMQQAVRNRAEGFIFASSGGAIYGETPHPAVETAAKAPISPYGAAKAAVENYLFAYRKTFGLNSVVLRYANVYGPRQDPAGEAGVVSIFTSALIAGGGVTIFGSGYQVRDYVFVVDVARANLLARDRLFSDMQTPRNPDESAFNIGSGRATSVNALYEELAKIIPASIAAVHAKSRPGELMESRLDITRGHAVLGFSPRVKLADGLLQTVAWQKNTKGTSGTRTR